MSIKSDSNGVEDMQLKTESILAELNGRNAGPYIAARSEWNTIRSGPKAGSAIPRWFVELECPECGQHQERWLDYARAVTRDGRPHLCDGCISVMGVRGQIDIDIENSAAAARKTVSQRLA
jgi:hypothetical protein